MLEDICLSDIVRNYYTYIRDRRNKELILDDPKSGQKVLASEYIDNSKIEDCVQKVKRDYLPIGVASVYRLLMDSNYGSEQVQVSFSALIQMEELLDRMGYDPFKGVTVKGKKPVIFKHGEREILRITRGESGYRRLIFTPIGQSTGVGIKKIDDYRADSIALDILDVIYNDELLELAFEDSDGPFSIGLNQVMDMKQELVARMLTAIELRRDVQRVQRLKTTAAVNSFSNTDLRNLVKRMLNTSVYERE